MRKASKAIPPMGGRGKTKDVLDIYMLNDTEPKATTKERAKQSDTKEERCARCHKPASDTSLGSWLVKYLGIYY